MQTKPIIFKTLLKRRLIIVSTVVLSLSISNIFAAPVKPESSVSKPGSGSTTLPKTVLNNFKPQVVTDKVIAAYFHKLLPTTTIDHIYTTPYPKTYALIIGANIVYGNLNSSYLTAGHMFNVYTQDDITTNLQRLSTPKVDLSTINISDALLVKSKNKTNKKIIVFIDPDCPYCRQLEQQLTQAQISSKADIYYMLMPLSMHPNAKQHTTNILCSTTPYKTLQDYMLTNNDSPSFKLVKDCNIEPVLQRTGSTARQLGINATPTIITGNGDRIMGADISAISEYVK